MQPGFFRCICHFFRFEFLKNKIGLTNELFIRSGIKNLLAVRMVGREQSIRLLKGDSLFFFCAEICEVDFEMRVLLAPSTRIEKPCSLVIKLGINRIPGSNQRSEFRRGYGRWICSSRLFGSIPNQPGKLKRRGLEWAFLWFLRF